MADYEEIWRSVVPEKPPMVNATQPQLDIECIALQWQGDCDGMGQQPKVRRGLVVRVGKYCQGFIRDGDNIAVIREEWDDQAFLWKTEVKIGNMEMPILAATKYRPLQNNDNWYIYYNIFLNEACHDRLLEQTEKLFIVAAIRAEFSAWSSAFRKAAGSIILRFFVGDAICFSYTLQQRRITGSARTAHFYRNRNTSLDPLVLNEDDYGANGSAPVSFTLSGSVRPVARSLCMEPIHMAEAEVANPLYRIYIEMFPGGKVDKMVSTLNLGGAAMRRIIIDSLPLHARTSFVSLLCLVKQRVLPVKAVKGPSVVDWKRMPPAVCITIKVPRSALQVFTKNDPLAIGAVPVHGMMRDSSLMGWQNFYSVVQLSFGGLSTSGTRFSDTFQINISEDSNTWHGDSPLFVSFMVPSWSLLLEPQAALVGFCIKTTSITAGKFAKKLGLEMTVIQTPLGDSDHVYITKNLPNQTGTIIVPGFAQDMFANPDSDYSGVKTKITASIDPSTCRVATLTARLDIVRMSSSLPS
ncbi:hypothetical protein N0V88_007560 [Collariella sp. IMI 366227]|nr:hypothetical protein N0V88_007560 [Collariella sp. IMI 366227]